MKKKKNFAQAYICLLALSSVSAQGKTTTEKPNVIIINMDDMGYGDIEPFGMTGIPTPNFNKLAQQGMRLTNFNAGQPVSSASRAALLTGCYPNRVGISGALGPQAKEALNPNEVTIASMLKKSGYTTAMLGKWHLGAKAPFLPIHYGFDSFFGLPYSNDMWPVDYLGVQTRVKKARPLLTLLEGDLPVDTLNTLKDQEKLTTLYTEKAVDFIKANSKKPFFLYLAHAMPHVPLAVSEKFKGKSELGLFGDVVMELDWSIGEILKAISDAKIDKKTILIVTSDNGPWKVFGNHAGSSGGFREGKCTSFEGGTRVPCIISWPGKVPQGMVNSALMTNIDILPTIAAATGANLPKNKIDGMNFMSMLSGKTVLGPREIFYYYYGTPDELRAVRYKSWKLVLPHSTSTYDSERGNNGQMGKYEFKQVPMALYDLARDPGETYDVQKENPEIMKIMHQIVEDAREDLGDAITNRKGENVRQSGIIPE